MGLKDDIKTHTMSSFVAGTVATTICAPADVLKSRIQSAAGGAVSDLNQRSPGDRADSFKSLAQIIRAGLREEGPQFLMKGWTPAWLRLTYVETSESYGPAAD